MRPALPIVLLALAAGGLAVYLWSGRDGDDESPWVAPDPPVVRVDDRGRPVLESRRALPTRAGKQVLRLRILDARSGASVPEARVLRPEDAKVLGVCDASGHVDLPGERLNTVVLQARGYFLQHFFDRAEVARSKSAAAGSGERIEVLLTPDDLTVRTTLRFVSTDGKPAADVRFRLECLEQRPPDPRSVPSSRLAAGAEIGGETRRAWRRHVLLAGIQQPNFTVGDPVFLGRWSAQREYRCEGALRIAFLAPGVYRCSARAGGEFRRQSFDVHQGGEVVVQLRAGGTYEGQIVRRDTGAPVGQAGVSLLIGAAIQAGDVTGADGKFRLGPLPGNAMRLVIHHPAFEEYSAPNVRVGGGPVVHRLVPKPLFAVQGVVQQRPGGEPVAGATVRVLHGGQAAAETLTDAAGKFRLSSFLLEPTVAIEKSGFLPYAESLNANGEVRAFRLLPATPEARLRAGLTGLVAGRLVDASGKPAAGRGIRVEPRQRRAGAPTFGGRRILRGGRLVPPQLVTTDGRGAFVVEWHRSEEIVLLAPLSGGVTKDVVPRVVSVRLGSRQQVELRDPR